MDFTITAKPMAGENGRYKVRTGFTSVNYQVLPKLKLGLN